MQLEFGFMSPGPLMEVHRRLLKAYVTAHGPMAMKVWLQLDPVSQMVLAILDGRTRESKSKRVFEVLRSRFVWWTALLNIPVEVLTQLISSVTYPERKAPQIRDALQQIIALRGMLELDFLKERSVEDARLWLENLPGVGPKVSAAVVNFSTLHMPALVVDSHYLRVVRRLGFVTKNASHRVTNRLLSRLVPDSMTVDELQQHYFLIKSHGQNVCRHRLPNCQICCLRTLCLTGKECVS